MHWHPLVINTYFLLESPKIQNSIALKVRDNRMKAVSYISLRLRIANFRLSEDKLEFSHPSFTLP